MAIIELEHLTRSFHLPKRIDGRFGTIRSLVTREYTSRMALNDMTFAIEPGESVAYLGPNGAGKSTTIKLMTGILTPTSGMVRVLGRTPWEHRQENAKRIGVVFGQRSQLWWDLPLHESFDLHRRMYAIGPADFRVMLDLCTETLGLAPFFGTPVRQLSLGQRMRGELAMALLHQPDVLFLDEPTIGLDVLAKDRIRAFLKQVNTERGTTIVLTTHDLGDIEEVTQRIIVVNHGSLVYDGGITALGERLGNQRSITLEFADDVVDVSIPGAELVDDAPRKKRWTFDRSQIAPLDLVASLPRNLPVSDIGFEQPDIEDVIRDLYASLGAERPDQEEIDTWTRGRVATR